jgi:Xaa-Pro aminopeptidase
LYIRADDTAVPAHFRGIGIRIEDDVLYGADGVIEVLSDACPRKINDIRAVINGE